jgi:hypothetical protein
LLFESELSLVHFFTQPHDQPCSHDLKTPLEMRSTVRLQAHKQAMTRHSEADFHPIDTPGVLGLTPTKALKLIDIFNKK